MANALKGLLLVSQGHSWACRKPRAEGGLVSAEPGQRRAGGTHDAAPELVAHDAELVVPGPGAQ
eukprot:10022991-Lingulodinium_polyedra.AAC.1